MAVRSGGVVAPRMIDVARLAGVSQQTVSRVLNDSAYVGDELRQRVETAVLELGYRRNRAARALVTRQSMHVGVIAVGTTKFGPAQALFGIAAQARKLGYATSIMSLEDPDRASMDMAIRELVVEDVDGIVVLAPTVAASEAVDAMSIPLPMIMYKPGAGEHRRMFAHDEQQASYEATRHLLDLGHPTVHHLAGQDNWLGTRERMRGWARALEEAGRFQPTPFAGDWSAASGYSVGLRLLAQDSPTAVFVANDQMALGFLKAVEESGLRVPHDISVVGFDDIPEAAFFQPALTTVHLDFMEVGRRCFDRVIELIRGGDASPVPLVAPYLVGRSSTAPYQAP